MAAKKKKAAAPKEHGCIAKVEKALASTGSRLLDLIRLDGGPRRIFVTTEKLVGHRGRVPHLAATFCPFCGKKMPE